MTRWSEEMWSIVPVPNALLEFIHSPPKPPKTPISTHTSGPSVLCLGLGRTGTESLQIALQDLGYTHVHHGFVLGTEHGIAECPKWTALAKQKHAHHKNPGSTPPIASEDLRAILAPYEATTDLPSALFGQDLLKAYPDAKVVLNRRKDVAAWHASQIATVGAIYRSGWPRLQRCVNGEIFWLSQAAEWHIQAPFDWDVDKNAVKFYEEHYRGLEEQMRAEGREWLDWTVEDGWGPLCEFLGKGVPVGKEFPKGNERGGFDEKRKRLHAKRMADADRKLRVIGGVLVVGIAGVMWKFWGEKLLE